MDVSLVHVQTMARYNRWMNQKVYDGCAGLADEDRKRDMGAFFKSIHGTLNHILLADRIWMGRFTGEPPHPNPVREQNMVERAMDRLEESAHITLPVFIRQAGAAVVDLLVHPAVVPRHGLNMDQAHIHTLLGQNHNSPGPRYRR